MTENNNLNEENIGETIEENADNISAEDTEASEKPSDDTADEHEENPKEEISEGVSKKSLLEVAGKAKAWLKDSREGRAFRVCAAVLAVCAVLCVLLLLVNDVTRDRIAENEINTKKEVIFDIFDKGRDCELYKTLEDGTEVYLVYRDHGIIGYCVFISAEGYSGEMRLAVGIDSDYATEGVRIISMNENPEFASMLKNESFLEGFNDKPRRDPVGDVDSVSGATVSSEAIKAAVLAVHCIELDLSVVCTEKNVQLITPDMLENVTDEVTTVAPSAPSESVDVTEPMETDPAETEPVSPDTAVTQTEPAETEDIPFVNNRGKHQFNYNVDASSVSDRFVIEIPKDDETATFETTTEPVTTPEPIVTEPPVTKPVVTDPPETNPVITEPPVTEAPTIEAETTEDPNEIPPWLDTQPEETMPPWLNTQEEETMPSWIGG